MRNVSRTIGLVCAAALIACTSDSTDSVTGPASLDAPPLAANVGGTIVAAADVGINFTVPPEVFGGEVGNLLTINARKREDGSVSGHYLYKQTFMGEVFVFSGPVTCMNVYDDNRAKVGGLIVQSNDPVFTPGFFIWWQVIDNGEGDGSVDQSTISGFGDEAANEAFCDDPAPPRFGPWDVQHGNIQVREG